MNVSKMLSSTAKEMGEESVQSMRENAPRYMESLRPYVDRHSRSGTLSAAVGALALARGLRSMLKGRRRKGMRQLFAGALWLGIAGMQRRRGEAGGDVDQRDVVPGTTDDLSSATTEEHGITDYTGAETGDLETGADIDDVEPADEVSTSDDLDTDADVTESEVVGEPDAAADESGESSEDEVAGAEDEEAAGGNAAEDEETAE